MSATPGTTRKGLLSVTALAVLLAAFAPAVIDIAPGGGLSLQTAGALADDDDDDRDDRDDDRDDDDDWDDDDDDDDDRDDGDDDED